MIYKDGKNWLLDLFRSRAPVIFSGYKKLRMYNEDCIVGAKKYLASDSVDLLICDPPFGIGEGTFDKFYARDTSTVLEGYVEAPVNYEAWTLQWVQEAYRVLRPGGTLYLVIGHSRLRECLNAADSTGFELRNHLIWKYNFGVSTQHKFVTSHYHILYLVKPGAKPTFNTNCRFGPQEVEGKSNLQYADLEDVFVIRKEFVRGPRNQNKLPSALVEKLVMYSSNVGDSVVDFFLGSFTTAYVAKRLGRKVGGFEINKEAFDQNISHVRDTVEGEALASLKQVVVENPVNSQKPFAEGERELIRKDYAEKVAGGMKKGEAKLYLQEKYGRGKWSIVNVLKDYV